MESNNLFCAARGLLGWTQAELADAAGLSPNTIKRLEAGRSITPSNRMAILRVLKAKGAELHVREAGFGVWIARAPAKPIARS